MMQDPTHASSGRPRSVVYLGWGSAIVSALGTWFYLNSLKIYPLFILFAWLAVRSYRQPGSPKTRSDRIGLALAIAALLMPLAAASGNAIFDWLDRRDDPFGPVTDGWPPTLAFLGPPLAVLIAAIVIGSRKGHADAER